MVTTEVACRTCSGSVTDASWRALPLARTISASEVRLYVSSWADDERIEVRACRDCGRERARRVRASAFE